jgi:hypothetical protein
LKKVPSQFTGWRHREEKKNSKSFVAALKNRAMMAGSAEKAGQRSYKATMFWQ